MKTYNSYAGTSTASPAYSDGDISRIINSTQSDNLTWGMELVNDSLRYLTTRYYFNERTYTTPTVSQTQFYNLPPQVKNLINVTVTIGSVVWQPKECPSRQFWDALNSIQFYQDFPTYFFVYNGQVGIFPTPSSAGNTITMHYKTRIVDLSMPDVTSTTASTTVSATNGSTTITAAGAAFKEWMEASNAWIRLPYGSTDASSGDNQWYQIDSVTSSTVLVLKNKYSGATVTGASFTIGQTPLLPEDYQDLPLYRLGRIYYTTRFPDVNKANLYKGLYDEGFAALDGEFGSKTTSVILNDVDLTLVNTNLFTQSLTQN